MARNDDFYNELAAYSLSHQDPAFIHQLVVDAYAAQHADENSKPIAVVFSLLGLYLHVEKGFTGRQVQRAHMQLAKWPNTWISPSIPTSCGEIVIQDVLASQPGAARDAMIERWCASVWQSWQPARGEIVALAHKYLGIG